MTGPEPGRPGEGSGAAVGASTDDVPTVATGPAEGGVAPAGGAEAGVEPPVEAAPDVVCASCGETGAAGARFCERCGAPLPVPGTDGGPWGQPGVAPEESADEVPTAAVPAHPAGAPARPCADCGGVVAADGYCESCGARAVPERDHWREVPVPTVAGVCDRGIRHARNEDAMALGAEPGFAALVVCDGVSTAPRSEVASLAAARAARDVLTEGGPSGAAPVAGEASARTTAWSTLLERAAFAADAAIDEAVGETLDGVEPPSCTFVAAVADGPLVVVGWLGDSRAYWFPDEGEPEQLTVDDSWASEMVAQGMARADAEAAPQAHAITRWLGPDSDGSKPRTAPAFVRGPGWLLLCSDGLWNYCSPPEDLAALLRATQERVGPAPVDLAADLVRWANECGGQDNITVALARLGLEGGPADVPVG